MSWPSFPRVAPILSIAKLILQRVVKVFPVFGCVDEAACVERNGRLVRDRAVVEEEGLTQ